MLVLDINEILDRQFCDLTPPLQESTGGTGNISKEKPSIFGLSASYDSAFMTRWLGFDIDSYLKYMKEKEELAQDYYSVHFRRELRSESYEFLQYLMKKSCLLCFAILLFQKVQNGTEILKGTCRENNSDSVDQRSLQFSSLYDKIMRDRVGSKIAMLTLEEQIPWFAVEAVFTHSNLSNLCNTRIERLAMSCFEDLYPRPNKSKVSSDTFTSGGFKHLLHMFHWTRTPHGKWLVDPQSEHQQQAKKLYEFYIPSATELQGSATDIKTLGGGSGTDVIYKNRRISGLMQITPLHVFPYTSNLFGQLIRFEQQYLVCGLPVTAYFACMKNLLQSNEDVKLMEKNGIVQNGGEKEVLDFVHNLHTHFHDIRILYGRVPCDLIRLSEKLMEHHQKSVSREYSEIKSLFFPNRWVIISIIGGLTLFILTFIQTIYTALSYYKP